MASIKIILRKKKNKEGKLPLCIQIIKDRKKSIIHLGQYIDPLDWDGVKQKVKKSHRNAHELNTYILHRLTEANSKLLELEMQKATITSRVVQQRLKAKSQSTFFAQAKLYLDTLKKGGKYNRLSPDKARVERFKDFLEGRDISFQEITPSLLNQFQAYLKGVWKNSQRSVMNNLVVIRSIFNQAMKDNIVDRKYYPFGKDKIRIKFPESNKIGLSIDDVVILEEIKLDTEPLLHHARNVWLTSFYFAGIRASDTLRLKWADFQNDRLHYAMGKNLKAGSLKVSGKALAILKEYASQKNKNDLVFPDLNTVQDFTNLYEVQKRIKNAIKRLDISLGKVSKLATINKPLTMHIARHTFGNISGDKIPIQMLQKLYRHTSITTTIGYQANFIHKDADEALDAVVNF